MLLSIIVPVYNVEKYIRKCLDSIFSQNFNQAEVEVIVVNDGTLDKSMDIVEEFRKEPSLKVINQTNQGLSSARNAGIRAASGNWMWFVDSDDWIEANAIEELLPILNSSCDDAIIIKLSSITEDGKRLKWWQDDYVQSFTLPGPQIILNHIPYTPAQQYLIRRKLVVDNNLFFRQGIYHEDHEWALRMLLSTEKVCFINKNLYWYLQRSGSITSSPTLVVKRINSCCEILKSQRQLLLKTTNKEKQDAIKIASIIVFHLLWSVLPKNQKKEWLKDPHNADILLYIRKLHMDTLLKSRTLGEIGRKMIFTISPLLLCNLNKDI